MGNMEAFIGIVAFIVIVIVIIKLLGVKNSRIIKYYDISRHPESVEYYEKGFGYIRRSGKCEYYYINGQPEMIGNYNDDKRNDQWLFYYPNGQLRIIGNYKDGGCDGKWTYYSADGQPSKVVTFKDGKKLENEDRFDKTETLQSEIEIK